MIKTNNRSNMNKKCLTEANSNFNVFTKCENFEKDLLYLHKNVFMCICVSLFV